MNMPETDRVAANRAAIAARRARAEVKAALRSGERNALAVAEKAWFDAKSPEASLRILDFLTSIPGIGRVKAERVRVSIGMSTAKRLGGLGKRQQEKLASWLLKRNAKSRLVVLAGPTAVGKGVVSAYIRRYHPQVLFSVSATTRPPRSGEVDGEHYHFVSEAEFERMVRADEFLEHATVHNNFRYGTLRAPIAQAISAGRSVLLEIDVQGARMVRAAMPDALLVFLLPPSWEELVRRLVGRGTESSEEQTRRLATAKVELAAQDEFDVRLINHRVHEVAGRVVELLGTSD